MSDVLIYLLMGIGSLCIFSTVFFLSMYFVLRPSSKRQLASHAWKYWKGVVSKERNENWEKLLQKAGYPFSWGKAEWIAAQCMLGTALLIIVILWEVTIRKGSFSIIALIGVPTAGFWIPYLGLRWWANIREEILSVDIARFINRYVNLLENHVPHYLAMEKAARPTKLLKQYVPTLSEWNKDRFEALERWKRDLEVDDAIILISNIRTIEQLSPEIVSLTMQRLEWAVDHRRMFRHRKKIKSLGLGYSIIVYPAFYMGLIVTMFPWYKLLTEILDKYLV